jgi:hypothetical protein
MSVFLYELGLELARLGQLHADAGTSC